MLAGFVAALEPINALADASPGFVWRLQGDGGGDATAVRGFGDDRIIVNMSTWESLDALADFVYRTVHADVMRSRRTWSSDEGGLLRTLVGPCRAPSARRRQHGPTPAAFTFKQPFPPLMTDASSPTPRDEECPA